jgi:hypothetical protein
MKPYQQLRLQEYLPQQSTTELHEVPHCPYNDISILLLHFSVASILPIHRSMGRRCSTNDMRFICAAEAHIADIVLWSARVTMLAVHLRLIWIRSG